MFKICRQSVHNPVPVSDVNLWEPEPNLWIIGVESSSDELELMAHEQGAIAYSPYGKGSPVTLIMQGDNRHPFYRARFWSTVDRHQEGDHKYFLIKWFCKDSEWRETDESSAIGRGLKWISDCGWVQDTPMATSL